MQVLPVFFLFVSIHSRHIPDTYPIHTRHIRISHEYSVNTPRISHEYLIHTSSIGESDDTFGSIYGNR